MPIEAKYVFPLDDKAAVCGFEAFINGKHVVGEVRENPGCSVGMGHPKSLSFGLSGSLVIKQDVPGRVRPLYSQPPLRHLASLPG